MKPLKADAPTAVHRLFHVHGFREMQGIIRMSTFPYHRIPFYYRDAMCPMNPLFRVAFPVLLAPIIQLSAQVIKAEPQ